MKLKAILGVTVLACMLSGALNIFAEDSETTVNDTDSSIRYSGKWLTQSNSQMYGGDEHYTNTAGSYAEFSFEGVDIKYIGTMSSNRGYFDVYIDGELVASDIDAYSPQLQTQQVLFRKASLSSGQHTIKIMHTGRKNPASQKAIIGVDAFISDTEGYWDPPIETNPGGVNGDDPIDIGGGGVPPTDPPVGNQPETGPSGPIGPGGPPPSGGTGGGATELPPSLPSDIDQGG